MAPSHLTDPLQRAQHYGQPLKSAAQFILDLHDSQTVFNFCGSLLFQFHLSPALRAHLAGVSSSKNPEQDPTIFPTQNRRMATLPAYEKSAQADNVAIFHGREIRGVKDTKFRGGQGCVLHLSMANAGDEEGWTAGEIKDYNGWVSDSKRPWRKAEDFESGGFVGFGGKFGPGSYGLHHRFYWHLDGRGQVWLSAEDGCEGEPVM